MILSKSTTENGQKGFTTFSSHERGFTLVELLVVIGILAVLLALTLIAINPARQFSQANNTKRKSDVSAVLNAVTQYMADNKGTVPSGITTTDKEISDTGANICSALAPKFIAALPADPKTNSGTAVTDCAAVGGYKTGYNISQSASDNRITVRAPAAELGETISVTR